MEAVFGVNRLTRCLSRMWLAILQNSPVDLVNVPVSVHANIAFACTDVNQALTQESAVKEQTELTRLFKDDNDFK